MLAPREPRSTEGLPAQTIICLVLRVPVLNGTRIKQELKNPSCELSQGGRQKEWCLWKFFFPFVSCIKGEMLDIQCSGLGIVIQNNCKPVFYETLGEALQTWYCTNLWAEHRCGLQFEMLGLSPDVCLAVRFKNKGLFSVSNKLQITSVSPRGVVSFSFFCLNFC